MKKIIMVSIFSLLSLMSATAVISAAEPTMEKSREAFDMNGCSGCHVIGKDWNGPDLTYVTTNRSKEWIIDFILHTKKYYDDPIIKDMIEVFNLYMPDQGVEPEDAELIYNYLKSLPGVAEKGVKKEEKTGDK